MGKTHFDLFQIVYESNDDLKAYNQYFIFSFSCPLIWNPSLQYLCFPCGQFKIPKSLSWPPWETTEWFFVKSRFFLCTLLTLDKLLIYMNNAKAFTYGCFFLSKTRKYPNMIEQKITSWSRWLWLDCKPHGRATWLYSTMIAGINTSYKSV